MCQDATFQRLASTLVPQNSARSWESARPVWRYEKQYSIILVHEFSPLLTIWPLVSVIPIRDLSVVIFCTFNLLLLFTGKQRLLVPLLRSSGSLHIRVVPSWIFRQEIKTLTLTCFAVLPGKSWNTISNDTKTDFFNVLSNTLVSSRTDIQRDEGIIMVKVTFSRYWPK